VAGAAPSRIGAAAGDHDHRFAARGGQRDSAGGATYNYRSVPLTANSTLSQGTHPYTLALSDSNGNSRTQTGFTVIVDNTAPSASDVQTVNKTGGTTGRPELGDQVLLTYSEPIDPNSILVGWSGAATNVVVRITDGGLGNDVLTIRNAANSAQLPLGSVDLRRTDFVSTTRNFGASGTRSQMTQARKHDHYHPGHRKRHDRDGRRQSLDGVDSHGHRDRSRRQRLVHGPQNRNRHGRSRLLTYACHAQGPSAPRQGAPRWRQ
jgi:hypothetical protein